MTLDTRESAAAAQADLQARVEDYRARLKAFDWGWRYRNCGWSQAERCRHELEALRMLQKEIDPDRSIWNETVYGGQ